MALGVLPKEVRNQRRDFFGLLPFDVVNSTLQPYHPNGGQIRFKELRIDANQLGKICLRAIEVQHRCLD
jgi:hypothetical protein